MKILVAVPTYETIYPDTFKSIYELDKGRHDVDFDFFRGYDVASARNHIGEAVLERGYDCVLMVDNDVVVPRDALLNLLEIEAAERVPGMAVGYCLARPANNENKKGRTTIFHWGAKDYLPADAYTGEELRSFREKGTKKIQVRGAGLGCAFVHKTVFEKMSYPWFEWILYDSGAQLSEDLYFCERFREIGLPIFVDTRVACGHMMRFVKNP